MASTTPLSEANSAFSLALLKQLSNNNQTGNIFFSISSALAMVMLGARGNTATQMSEEFLVQSKQHYGTELESVDFKTRSEEVRIDINHWVQKHTPGHAAPATSL